MDISGEFKSELDHVREAILPQSSLYLTLSESDSDNNHDSPYQEHPTHLSVTAVLHYCKCKILRPYLRVLSITGLRSLTVEQVERCTFWDLAGFFYTLLVVCLMLLGYLLQYMSCFRRDRGFCYKLINPDASILRGFENEAIVKENVQKYEQICHGSVVFSYVIPNCLHLCAYLYGVFIFRSTENDQLPSLMERVFLSSSHITDGFVNQKKLVRLLWIFVSLSIVWMLLSCTTVNFMMFEGTINFRWLETRPLNEIIMLKVMLIIGTLWHDMIQATVISSYCLQAQLLTSYLHFLRAKLLQYPIHSIDWMREISEFRKLLKYLNRDLSTPVCLFTFINLCYTISGAIWLLGFDHVDKETLPITGISILNVVLWLTLTLAPFLQAARLTGACKQIQTVGHEVRARPFVHQGTPGSELDSLLLYASSLDMNATLFKIPITGRNLAVGITFTAVLILVIGQCHYFNL